MYLGRIVIKTHRVLFQHNLHQKYQFKFEQRYMVTHKKTCALTKIQSQKEFENLPYTYFGDILASVNWTMYIDTSEHSCAAYIVYVLTRWPLYWSHYILFHSLLLPPSLQGRSYPLLQLFIETQYPRNIIYLHSFFISLHMEVSCAKCTKLLELLFQIKTCMIIEIEKKYSNQKLHLKI